MAKTDSIPCTNSVEDDIEYFTGFIISATTQTIPRTEFNPKQQPVHWWAPELKAQASILARKKNATNKYQKIQKPKRLYYSRKISGQC